MPKDNKEQAIEVEEVTCAACLKIIPFSEAQSKNIADNIIHFCGLDCYDDWKHQKSSGNSDYNINFLIGIYGLWEYKYEQARDFFLKAVTETNQLDAQYDVYLSYLGLSEVLIDNKNGALQHSNHSFNTSLSIKPEIQLNLACAELIKGNRKRSVQAVHKIDDLKLSPRNSEELHSFYNIIGKREKDDNGSLKRNKFFHKTMGKVFRNRASVVTGRVELFIINTAQERYSGAMAKMNNQLL